MPARGADALSILGGNGDGTFRAADTFPLGGAKPRTAAAVDLNDDGRPDLVVVENLTNDVSVLLNATP